MLEGGAEGGRGKQINHLEKRTVALVFDAQCMRSNFNVV